MNDKVSIVLKLHCSWLCLKLSLDVSRLGCSVFVCFWNSKFNCNNALAALVLMVILF